MGEEDGSGGEMVFGTSDEIRKERENDTSKKIEIICGFGFEASMYYDPTTDSFYKESGLGGYKKKRLLDNLLPWSWRTAGYIDGDGNQLQVHDTKRETFCKGRCIETKKRLSGHQTACACLKGLEYDGKINSVCGGTVYVPKTTSKKSS